MIVPKKPIYLIAGIVIPLLTLVFLEMLLTLSGSGSSLSLVRPCMVSGRNAYCDNSAFTSTVFPPGMTRPATPYAFIVPKERGSYRIFVLGESAAEGDPDPAYSFSRYLDLMLRHAFPQRHFEVINASITAINSHVLLRMAKELSAYQPDLVVVYAGNNEVIGPYGPGTTLSSEMPSLPVIRANIAFRATRLGQLAVKLTEKPRQFRGMEMFLGRQVPADSPDLPRVYDYLAENLRAIVVAAKAANADVVLSTVGTNLRDCPPFNSLHRPGLSVADRQQWEGRWDAGRRKQESGDYAGALQDYLAADGIDSQFAELQFRIATCLSRLGDVENARRRFSNARDLDTLRFRADTGINDAIRRVAKQESDAVTLVDTEAILADASADGIPGRELFFDHVHLRPNGNYLVASSIYQRIEPMVRRRLGSPEADNHVLSEAECDRQLALTDYDFTRLVRAVRRRLQRPPFTAQLDNQEQIALYSAEERQHTVPLQTSLAVYEWAITGNPNDCLLRQNLGLLLYGIDRSAAISQLRLSRPYHDTPLYMPDGTRIE